MRTTVIDIRDLCFRFNGAPVLHHVDLAVHEGDFLAVIGPNGGGKTTLLKLMLGLLTPASGSIRIFDRPPQAVSHRIGYVPQDVNINTRFPVSVLDVVLMGRLRPGRSLLRHTAADRARAAEMLDRVEMADLRDRRIGALSGGQKQRVMVARALAGEPDILFLDEPTASIDAKGQGEFHRLLKDLNRSITILVVSHDLMVVSGFANSVACVNQSLHYHDKAEVTADMIDMMYRCAHDESCPVELVSHGVPHRVLRRHGDARHD
jgi:zinc transport system ATP-binding protein